jgi:hypothetical protein
MRRGKRKYRATHRWLLGAKAPADRYGKPILNKVECLVDNILSDIDRISILDVFVAGSLS